MQLNTITFSQNHTKLDKLPIQYLWMKYRRCYSRVGNNSFYHITKISQYNFHNFKIK